ncbi:hypothetical protein MMUR_26570 [Mycolicibacterium murale]|uniref:Uncharacterized protein n=1 Tax=Mycolicibacterium murale TaxID=182220 RepID=A0A7I9WLA1_9MYCO|nr:hypothetical protein MMUR_26570 [Mycolicibacterium murale]
MEFEESVDNLAAPAPQATAANPGQWNSNKRPDPTTTWDEASRDHIDCRPQPAHDVCGRGLVLERHVSTNIASGMIA